MIIDQWMSQVHSSFTFHGQFLQKAWPHQKNLKGIKEIFSNKYKVSFLSCVRFCLSMPSILFVVLGHLTRYLKQESYTTNTFLNSDSILFIKKIYLPFTVADEDRGGEDWELRKTEDWGRQRIEDNQVADSVESRWTGERRPKIAWRATTDDCVETGERE